MTLDFILTLEFTVINYCMFQSTTRCLIFLIFFFDKCRKTWEKQLMKSQNFHAWPGLGIQHRYEAPGDFWVEHV